MADKVYLTAGEALRELVNAMPPHDCEVYNEFKSLRLESAFPGRVLIVYTLRNGRPVDIEAVKFGELEIRVQTPPSIRVTYRTRLLLFNTVPSRLADRDVYLSVPQNFKFEWAGQRINGVLDFRPHYAVLIKTRSKEDNKVEGNTYCVTLKRFREMYPESSDQARF